MTAFFSRSREPSWARSVCWLSQQPVPRVAEQGQAEERCLCWMFPEGHGPVYVLQLSSQEVSALVLTCSRTVSRKSAALHRQRSLAPQPGPAYHTGTGAVSVSLQMGPGDLCGF